MSKTIALLLLLSVAAAANAQTNVRFNRDVRPILADKCFHCHGPDAAERQAGLRLDQEESTKRDREGSFAVKAGDPDASELVHRVLSDDPDLQMPPPNSGRSLNAAEKETLVRWINEGAKWEGHWSFIAPKRPALPSVKDHTWPLNEIDRFVLQRLEQAGLQPSPTATKSTWLRRVTFDLTGLPPTLSEVDAFLADGSETAHETVVDRLLQSPHYGEHMAATWLDVARYADTDGYQNDGPRTMFRWRDWVIDAYNSNLPFDQFTVEQLAGDLLPNATHSQQIATGFNRNHRYNSEAGLVLEEFLLENAVDRVDTTSTVWMGLTMGCARCHDHKYDPFSQREYYQLISFFDNISESGRAIKFGNSEPWVGAPTDVQQKQLAQIDQQIHDAQRQLAERDNEFDTEIEEFELMLANADIANLDLSDREIVPRGLAHHFHFEEMKSEGIAVESGKPVLRAGLFGNSATVGGHGVLTLGSVGDVACQTRSSVSIWLKPEDLKSGVVLSRQSGGTTRPGFSVELRDGHLQFFIITRWVAGVGAVETLTPLTVNEWVHVVLTNDGSQRAKGQQVWINGQLANTKTLYNTNSNTGGTKASAILRIGGGVHGKKFKGQVDELFFYNRTLFDDEIALLAERSTVAEILSTPLKERTREQTLKLRAWILAMRRPGADSTLKESSVPPLQASKIGQLYGQYCELREKRIRLLDSFPTAMVMEELPKPRETRLRIRGEYHNHGNVVFSNTPETFPPLPESDDPARLRFAKWLVNGQHPLTARVTVNRYWQQYFGAGLVRTPEDFGLQGELPSHPELLDWLAVHFVESGWDVKAMQKLIVLSAAYRQSSRHSPSNATQREGRVEAATIDSENRLLWRGPRLRLSARQLRDQALFISGLLTSDIGGPSVSPYQPANLWAEMSNMKYKQSTGKDLYRRGLYTIWKRTVAPPSLAILDAADRENCIVRQKRTNTPLQALTLLNETTFVESARHMALRMQHEGGDQPVVFAFRTVTARFPTEAETTALTDARNQYFAEFETDPKQAKLLLSVGESVLPEQSSLIQLAADTILCNVLLNLDETVTKE